MLHSIERLFHANHRVDRDSVRVLTSQDVDTIRAMVLGKQDCAGRIRAIGIFAATGHPDAPDVFSTVLDDQQAETAVRATAATYLARVAGPKAEGVFLNSLTRASDPLLRVKLVAALGRI